MTAVENLITDNFDVWSSSIRQKATTGRGSSKKIELYGVKRLRELILDLAIRGLLVPQNAEDASASELLKEISKQKEELVKQRGLRKPKSLSDVADSETPFTLPEDWSWVRLGSLGLGSTGKTPSTKNLEYFDGDIPFVGPGQISPAGEILKAEKSLTELGMGFSEEAILGDLLMVCIGGSIGKSAISRERIAFNQQINALRPVLILSSYLKIAVSSTAFQKILLDKSTGSATPIINRSKWEELLVPLAPLNEQRRIVTKVDELMALCDALETQQENSITAHQALVEALLSALTNASEKDSFDQAWARISEHFDILFTTEHSIDQLKQTILQLAVMVKLVPQDANDEPASVLLEKIAAEKERLIKDKKIKKQKEFPEITLDEFPIRLPKGWEKARVSELLAEFQNGASSRGDKDGKEIIVLRLADIKDWKVS